MDFDIPADIAAYLRELDEFIAKYGRSNARMTISASSTIAANTRAPTGTMTVSRVTSGKSFSPR
jgi:hypothetical protein